MSKNKKYWQDRMVQLELNALKKGEDYYKNLQQQYEKAIHDINLDITVWYERLAQNNEINLSEAMKKLTANELKEFKWTLKDYIKYGKENSLNQDWIRELENASAKYHINRLQQIHLQMKAHLEELAHEENKGMTNTLSNIYEDTYYRTAFEIQRGLNIGSSFETIDKNRIEKVLNRGWIDGKNYSDRIWNNKEKLVRAVNNSLTQMIIRGESPDKAIKTISATMGVSKRQAGRLVMTESAMMASVAQKDCYKALDVEEFEIVATLDSDTCEECGHLDGVHLPMSQYKVNETAPPFHVNCRCCTAPYFADDEGERIARNENGESNYVPSNMKYDEWKEKYIENTEKRKSNLKNESKNDIIKKDKDLSFEECKSIIEKNKIGFVDEDLKGIDNKLLSDNVKQLDNLLNKYPVMKEYIEDKKMYLGAENFRNKGEVAVFSSGIDNKKLSIHFSKQKYKDYVSFIESERKDINSFYSMPCMENMTSVYSLTHEFGHFIENKFIDDYNKEHLAEFLNMKTKALNAKSISQSNNILTKWQMKITDTIARDIFEIAKNKNPNFNLLQNLSEYGHKNSMEFFAESFANMECGKPNELGEAMMEYLKQKGVYK